MLLSTLFCNESKSQNNVAKLEAYRKKMGQVLNTNMWKVRSDSIYVYAFNFRIEVLRDKLGKTSVQKVGANDSLAYQVFLNYHLLKTIDYSFLGQGRKKFTVFIPVLVYFKNHNEQAVIKVNAALNAMYALYSKTHYDNEKEKDDYVGYRNGLESRENPNYEMGYSNLVYMPLSIVHLFMIQ